MQSKQVKPELRSEPRDLQIMGIQALHHCVRITITWTLSHQWRFSYRYAYFSAARRQCTTQQREEFQQASGKPSSAWWMLSCKCFHKSVDWQGIGRIGDTVGLILTQLYCTTKNWAPESTATLQRRYTSWPVACFIAPPLRACFCAAQPNTGVCLMVYKMV